MHFESSRGLTCWRHWLPVALCVLAVARTLGAPLAGTDQQEEYLDWAPRYARKIALSTRVNGQVGKSLDFRVIHTERSYNFKLRATWLTPEVIRARARLVQLAERLSPEQTRTLVETAEAAGDTLILVEIDPREGSGVIPSNWSAFLQPRKSGEVPGSRGVSQPKLRDLRVLSGVFPRDYSYDHFWMVFDLQTDNGPPLLGPDNREVELVVQIHSKVGRVRWRVPNSILERTAALLKQRSSH